MKIKLVSYNPKWKSFFEKEAVKLKNVLRDFNPVVEHIGSTSVEGLGAKPVIDILIGIEDFNRADETMPNMKRADYLYVSKYENIMPERRYFTRVDNRNKFHIHLVEYNGSFWKRHIIFRNYLREFDNVRDEYFNLKAMLSEKEWDDKNEYTEAKSEFIKRIEKEAEEFYLRRGKE